MRKRLGEAHWAAFVWYAEAEHKAAFFVGILLHFEKCMSKSAV